MMKTKVILKLTFCITLIVCVGLVSSTLFGNNHTLKVENNVVAKSKHTTLVDNHQQADVIITIDKNTKDVEFEDIKEMLAENGIQGFFDMLERNDQGEITGIKITMISDNGQSSNIQLSSTLPIDTISFGRKNGQIFVEQNGTNMGNFAMLNNPNFFSFGSPNDSIFQQQFQNLNSFNFDDFFQDSDKFMFQFGDSTSIGDLMKQMHSRFNATTPGYSEEGYSLKNDPSAKDYLIILDGKELPYSDALKLEEEGRISGVEVISPGRAKLYYGEKAKNGAVILSTK